MTIHELYLVLDNVSPDTNLHVWEDTVDYHEMKNHSIQGRYFTLPGKLKQEEVVYARVTREGACMS